MRRHDQRGTITIWVLGLCVAVFFLGGLSVDLWRGIAVRHALQASADAAAVAGADGVDPQSLRAGGAALDPTLARRLAVDSVAQQSDAALVDSLDVTVAGNDVEVVLHGHVHTSLLGVLLGGGRFDITVHAVAQPRRLP